MRIRPIITASALTFALALVLTLGSPVARAATPFDYLFNPAQVVNDHQLFLNLAVGNFGVPRPALEPMLPRMRSVEIDLPVVLFLARESGRPVSSIVDLRARGLDWSVIATRVQVAPDVFFAGIDRDPGPPYGYAWGHWKRNHRRVRLSDSDIAGLVQIQIGHRIDGRSSFELAHACNHTTVVRYVADRHGRHYADGRRGDWREGKDDHQHGHGRGHDGDRDNERGHGKRGHGHHGERW